MPEYLGVASFTDAWIETQCRQETEANQKSHLLQMRGLKQNQLCRHYRPRQSHLLQMRGLKRYDALNMPEYLGRIFYRCVD